MEKRRPKRPIRVLEILFPQILGYEILVEIWFILFYTLFTNRVRVIP